MPPPLILDPTTLDFSKPLAARAEIERVNPHRYEFALLDGVVMLDTAQGIYAGFHDVREDAFWVRGHVPGRPLFPGVLMIEAAAQLASYLYHRLFPNMGFLGFTGVDDVKFRGVVAPPCRLVIVGRGLQMRPRRMLCASQGFVGPTMVFEAVITGMPV
jgi:3-hydroxyacyl-[acyl-carrier-protein] dehydratase